MKKNKEIEIEFIGNNAINVTGSCTLISFNGRTIAYECGGIQEGHTILDNYKLNREMMQRISPKKIDMIISAEHHQDHVQNICSVYSKNKDVRIIFPQKSKPILKEMWEDASFILDRDIETLSKQYPNKKFEKPFSIEDVGGCLDKVEEYSVGEIHKLDENISIRYIYSGHILGTCQCEIIITLDNKKKKILFTSDLGNVQTSHLKPFVEKFQPIEDFVDLVIGECTYGSRSNVKLTKKIVEKDLEKIRTVIDQYCNDMNRRVLIPTFSLDRTPNILWLIYQMFKDDEKFNSTVIIDSPLSNRLLDVYSKLLDGDAKEKFDEMMSWKYIRRVIDPMESKNLVKTESNCLVISSSGMLICGRSLRWATNLLPYAEDCILFAGYAGEGTVAWRIKNGSDKKTININGSEIKNRCNIVNIKSQSSHMQRNDLLDYYSSIKTKDIYLVHGEMQGKVEFAEDLKKEISNKSSTTKIHVVNSSTKIKL